MKEVPVESASDLDSVACEGGAFWIGGRAVFPSQIQSIRMVDLGVPVGRVPEFVLADGTVIRHDPYDGTGDVGYRVYDDLPVAVLPTGARFDLPEAVFSLYASDVEAGVGELVPSVTSSEGIVLEASGSTPSLVTDSEGRFMLDLLGDSEYLAPDLFELPGECTIALAYGVPSPETNYPALRLFDADSQSSVDRYVTIRHPGDIAFQNDVVASVSGLSYPASVVARFTADTLTVFVDGVEHNSTTFSGLSTRDVKLQLNSTRPGGFHFYAAELSKAPQPDSFASLFHKRVFG